jgi:hypothetical protein
MRLGWLDEIAKYFLLHLMAFSNSPIDMASLMIAPQLSLISAFLANNAWIVLAALVRY